MERAPVLRKIRRLGQGGYAETWLAEVLDRDLAAEWQTARVAIKIPYPEYERTFKKEIQLAGALLLQLTEAEQRNVVRYLGFELLDGVHVMVMEYVPDGSLRDRLGLSPHARPLPVPDALALAFGVLNGLAVVHAHRIHHRDIKPENILLDGPVPKLSDLGLARMARTHELSSTRAGTPWYAAPEVVAGTGADTRADLWSFGMTLYECLYGRLPFDLQALGSPLAVARRLADGTDPVAFPAPGPGLPEIPAGLRSILARCLSRDPAARYPEAAAIRADLRALLQPDDTVVAGLARKLLAQGRHPAERPAVLTGLQDLVRRYPYSPLSHYHLGEFLQAAGEPAAAFAAFQRGLGLHPDDPHLNWGLGVALHQRGEPRAAAAALDRALRAGLPPDLARGARLLLARLAVPAGRPTPT
ncbi:MAG: serine/threonine protein kinase [Candidatus Ozemobacter sibiricus]|jgi:serine/threonine-protein kinase|uniref:Serine/threonine protein kinase n=1 Tax=Candidatus Ozemobacter sibiricus TaxID=2268124 RepID=A0A367ZT84_9BACT|nr:MAG: serine/threonine protein kinase [Candidatus Ozemobacter sibiricus]